MKICPVGAKLFPVDRLDAVVTFRSYVNAPENESGNIDAPRYISGTAIACRKLDLFRPV
jgi:hypothetical protein